MNIYSKIIKVLVILALFTPLVISKGTLFPFVFGKAIAFQILVELMLIVYLLALAKSFKFSSVIARSPALSAKWRDDEAISLWRPRFSALTLALSAFFAVLIFSTIFGVDPFNSFWSKHERMEGLFNLAHYFVFFLILTGVFRKKEDVLGLLKWSVIAAFLVSLHALFGQIFGLPGFVKGYGVSGTLGNSSFLATYLVFNAFFALFLFLEKTKGRNARPEQDRWIEIPVPSRVEGSKSLNLEITKFRNPEIPKYLGVLLVSAIFFISVVSCYLTSFFYLPAAAARFTDNLSVFSPFSRFSVFCSVQESRKNISRSYWF